jgi:hypothetical protein
LEQKGKLKMGSPNLELIRIIKEKSNSLIFANFF